MVEDIVKEAGYASYNACTALGRQELYLDIRQDLIEMMLRKPGIKSRKVLRLRAMSFVISKRYNETYANMEIHRVDIPYVVNPHYDESILAEQLLDRLPPDARETVILWMSGLKHREIAEQVGISRSGVSKRIKEALKIIKEAI